MVSKRKPKNGDEVRIKFYDHFSVEGETLDQALRNIPCIMEFHAKLVAITDEYYMLEKVACNIVANSEYWAVLKDTVIDLEILKRRKNEKKY